MIAKLIKSLENKMEFQINSSETKIEDARKV